MHIDSAFPSKYLKASDLQGRNVTVKMGRVEQEKIGDDMKLILYFQGKEKGVVLNKTNATNISDAYGPDTDEWTGRKVVLYTAFVDFQGRSVESIRIRKPRDADLIHSGPAEQKKAVVPPQFDQGDPGFSDSDIPF